MSIPYRQLLTAMDFLHSHNIIHTDLKLENILLVHNEVDYIDKYTRKTVSSEFAYGIRSPEERPGELDYGGKITVNPRVMMIPRDWQIKVIDFGGATYENAHKSTIISTRQYRGPEVTLEIGWSFPSDIWSCGCIIAEIISGELLFSTHDNLEHLALIEKLIGFFPWCVVKKSELCSEFFHRDGLVRFEDLDLESKDVVKDMPYLTDFVRSLCHREDNFREVYQLLRELLIIDPLSRVKAREALDMAVFR